MSRRASDIRITKQLAAQRQIDAAIRMLFAGEDPLAVHTIVAAAHGIISDLAKIRGIDIYADIGREILRELYEEKTHETIPIGTLERLHGELKECIHNKLRYPANFLKHANRDSDKSVKQEEMKTDELLAVSCDAYLRLGLKFTLEMAVFRQWHLAVYPADEDDEVWTADGYVHDMPRDSQIVFGNLYFNACQSVDSAD